MLGSGRRSDGVDKTGIYNVAFKIDLKCFKLIAGVAPTAWNWKCFHKIIAAYKREGAAVTKRDNVHRMADANKAFAHFAW